MDVTVPPPALPGTQLGSGRESLLELGNASGYVIAHEVQHARHSSEHRNVLAMNLLGKLGRNQSGLKVQLRRQQRRNPQAHELTENVTQRKRVQNTNRVKDPLILEILLHLALDRLEAGEHVSVRMDDSFRLPGGARCENDLQGVVWREIADEIGCPAREGLFEIAEEQRRKSCSK